MNLADETLLAALVAFALGLLAGRLWSLFAGRDGSRHRLRSWSVPYIQGLDLLASKKLDRAVEELTKAARENSEATDVYLVHLVLGNLLREKGQIERAIQIHQGVLHRPRLSRGERAYALLCLATDFRRAGFRNRALETLQEVLALEPRNVSALASLVKIYEEERDWEAALRMQVELAGATGTPDARVEAFLHDRIGIAAEADGDTARARRAFEASMRAEPFTPPARVHIGDLLERDGRLEEAETTWSELARARPHLAYLVFERLARVRSALGAGDKTEASYLEIIEADARDWRARRALARLRAEAGRVEDAFELLLEATRVNPHAVAVQLDALALIPSGGEKAAEWLARYREALSGSAVFLDPHVCTRCSYRTNGILWRCPHCQEWDTFVEERLD